MLRGDLAERPRIGNGSLTDIPARSWSYVTLGFGHGEEWWWQSRWNQPRFSHVTLIVVNMAAKRAPFNVFRGWTAKLLERHSCRTPTKIYVFILS